MKLAVILRKNQREDLVAAGGFELLTKGLYEN